jgi:hypothetical protein
MFGLTQKGMKLTALMLVKVTDNFRPDGVGQNVQSASRCIKGKVKRSLLLASIITNVA